MNVWEDITDLAQKDVLSGFVTSDTTGQMALPRGNWGDISLQRSFFTSCFDRGSYPWGISKNTYVIISHAKRTPQ